MYLKDAENEDDQKLLRYGTENPYFAGSHDVELHVALSNYTSNAEYPEDTSTRINMTFYRQRTNLEILDQEYEINSGPFAIPIPELNFFPPLHASADGDTTLHDIEIQIKRNGAY